MIIGEGVPSLLQGRGARGEVSLVSLAAPCTKRAFRISTVRKSVPLMEEAFADAKSGIWGPVFAEVTRDVFFSQEEMMEQYQELIRVVPREVGLLGTILQKFYLANTYATDSVRVRPSKPLRLAPLKPSDFLVGKTLRVLKRAERPLILIGSQAVPKSSEIDALQSLLVNLGVPLFLFGDAKGLLGDDWSAISLPFLLLRLVRNSSPFFFSKCSPVVHYRGLRSSLQKCDFLLLLGMSHDYQLQFGEAVLEETFMVSVNKSKIEIMKNRLSPFVPF